MGNSHLYIFNIYIIHHLKSKFIEKPNVLMHISISTYKYINIYTYKYKDKFIFMEHTVNPYFHKYTYIYGYTYIQTYIYVYKMQTP